MTSNQIDMRLERSPLESCGNTFVRRLVTLTMVACLLYAASDIATAQAKAAMQVAKPISCGERLPGDTRPRIGLVLGGGGARGFAHISVLRMLEDMRIPVDCIAGTSMGSLVGGLYASGMSVDALEELVASTDWKQMFNDELPRKDRSYRRKMDDRAALTTIGVGVGEEGLKISPGMLQGERILSLLERDTLPVSGITDFDLLPIPFRAVATDLNTGQAVVLGKGSLPMAMRASMSLPGIFQPAEIDGVTLLDGGLVNQVPVDVVRDMGADIVIAVDVGTPMEKLGSDASLLEVVMQMSGMMTTGNTRAQLSTLVTGDVLITPDLGNKVSTGDFTKAREALAIGMTAADAARPSLVHLSLPADSPVWIAHQRPHQAYAMPVIDFVRVDNRTDYADALLLSYVEIPLGKPLDPVHIENGLLGAYGLGTLSSINYQVIHEGDRTGVLLTATPKPQGPNYLQLGLTMNTDFEGSFDSNLRAALLFSPLSPYGAEGRVTVAIGSEPELFGEYYHPLDASNHNVLYARGGYRNPSIHVFNNEGDNIATYDVRAVGINLQAIREFGNYGALTLGLERVTGRADVEVGDPQLEDFDFQQGNFLVQVNVDRLDSLFFPRDGYYATLGYTGSRESLGSDSNYSQLDFDTLGAKSFGKHAVQLGLSYHSTISGELPVQDRYRLGGRAQLSGFRFNELTGQHYALMLAGYTYQLAEVFGRSAQVGGTVEYGNAWEQRQDMRFDDGILNASIYAGFDSWVGPMLMGYGWREGGSGVLFLQIGRPF